MKLLGRKVFFITSKTRIVFGVAWIKAKGRLGFHIHIGPWCINYWPKGFPY